MIISIVAAKLLVSQKMYGFYWATLYIAICDASKHATLNDLEWSF